MKEKSMEIKQKCINLKKIKRQAKEDEEYNIKGS